MNTVLPNGNLISELKTAGAKGSLSKMNRTQLSDLHAQMILGSGTVGKLPKIAPIAGSLQTEIAVETGTGQRPQRNRSLPKLSIT